MTDTKKSKTQTAVRLMVYVLLLGLMIWFSIPIFRSAKVTAHRNACVANLKQLDGVRVSWSLENKKGPDDLVDIKSGAGYLRGGLMPVCPAGGSYQVKRVKDLPTCTLGHALGHSLP